MRNKLIATGVGLFGYGLLWGWAITGDHLERKMKSNQLLLGDIINRKSRELDSARELIMRDFNRTASVTTTLSENVDLETDVETSVEVEENTEDVEEASSDEVPEGETPEETRSRLQSYIDVYTTDSGENEELLNPVLAHDEVTMIPPFVISRQKYSWDEEEGDEYEKTTLSYYPREGVLLDEDQEIIEDLTATIGMECLNRFGDDSGDADTVYVRNRRLATDFEVVRETGMEPPAHVRYGLDRDAFEVKKAAGLMRLRPGDE